MVYEAEGDCCSDTWTLVKSSGGVDANPFQEAESRSSGHWIDCLQIYHSSFVTAKGEIVVEYRNNSNGYYGGSLYGPLEKVVPT